jgi:UDP-N-acetylmuramoyl-tripeptide--D-alanyl-D-alanine ligase
MIPLRAGEIAALTGGQLVGGDADLVIPGPVLIDSRQAGAGSLFVCLVGDHTDGHEYVGDALRRGAALSLAARPVDGPAIIVDDPQRALGFLAGGLMRRRPGVRVTGVTGSSGKTSTKDLLAEVMRESGPTIAPVGSYNNEIGLPLTVLQVDESTAHLVLEYSARGAGHIAYLTAIARPDTAVVLNIGTAHLDGFGSREAIAAAKGELVEALPADGVAVLNADDPLVAAMASRTSASVMTFGVAATADVRLVDVTLDEQIRASFRLVTADGKVRISLGLHGRHQASNAAAAAAAGLAAGLPLDLIAESLDGITAASAHRMAVSRRSDGLLVVDDAYNANPESMTAALQALVALTGSRGGRSWAVLGEMRELGDDTPTLHAGVGRLAAELGVDHLVVVGDVASAIGTGARSVAGWPGEATEVATAAEAGLVAAGAGADDVVLVKASNSIALWSVAEQLLAGSASGVGA